MQLSQVCGDCRYFTLRDVGKGFCHCHPPQAVTLQMPIPGLQRGTQVQHIGIHPPVSSDMPACKEYVEKEQE